MSTSLSNFVEKKKVMAIFVVGNLAFFGIGKVGKISIFLVPQYEF